MSSRDQSAHKAELASCFHLGEARLADKACRGLACFVARHRDPVAWSRAVTQGTPVYCLGQCFAAPAAGISARPGIEARCAEPVVLRRMQHGSIHDFNAYLEAGGCRALQQALAEAPSKIIDALDQSGLRGRGGAGFPTGRKWRAAANAAGPEKYVIANADEGDPGAYIDRFIMEDDPFALLEAMVLAGYAIGAHHGWIYLRGEYPQARQVLERAIADARTGELLGHRVMGNGFAFDVQLAVGRGSYLSGEETALVSALEHRRPEPRTRPPYMSERGLFGCPTLVNNVETLANVPWIVEHGGTAYHDFGHGESRGTKLVSLNSLFERPGLYEIEFGITLRELVEDIGGGLHTGKLHGLMIGGPLAGIIPPHLLGTRFDFEELRSIGACVGHGGVVAFDEGTSIAELMHHVFSFGAFESCGKCAPCRLGTRCIESVFEKIAESGAADYWDEVECAELVEMLKRTSLCGHGAGLAEFAESALRHYAEELEPCFR